MGHASTLASLGRPQEALAGFEEARAVYRRFGRKIEAARCTMNRAVALSSLGRFDEASAGFDEARAVYARFCQASRS